MCIISVYDIHFIAVPAPEQEHDDALEFEQEYDDAPAFEQEHDEAPAPEQEHDEAPALVKDYENEAEGKWTFISFLVSVFRA